MEHPATIANSMTQLRQAEPDLHPSSRFLRFHAGYLNLPVVECLPGPQAVGVHIAVPRRGLQVMLGEVFGVVVFPRKH